MEVLQASRRLEFTGESANLLSDLNRYLLPSATETLPFLPAKVKLLGK
jgi:hypothetical protein